MNRTPFFIALTFALGAGIGGCSSDDEGSTEHVWKDQTETIDKAREVENVLKNAADKSKKSTDNSGY